MNFVEHQISMQWKFIYKQAKRYLIEEQQEKNCFALQVFWKLQPAGFLKPGELHNICRAYGLCLHSWQFAVNPRANIGEATWTKSKRKSSATTSLAKRESNATTKFCKKRIKCNNQVLQKENQEQKTKIKSSATTKSCKKNSGTKVHAIVGSWRPTLW